MRYPSNPKFLTSSLLPILKGMQTSESSSGGATRLLLNIKKMAHMGLTSSPHAKSIANMALDRVVRLGLM